MTVRKRLQFAKMICRAAVRRKLIDSDPFADVGIHWEARPNPGSSSSLAARAETGTSRWRPRPNHHWACLIVALSRYGGMRCPSEVLSLRWQDVDWDAGRIVVQSPKTGDRIPRAPASSPCSRSCDRALEEAFELAPDGAVYVVDERMRASAQGKAGWRGCNLRTTFEKIIRRAGLTPWPRQFHSLRSSRQTELAETFPAHVVCSWLGNSEDVAREHYLQVTNQHFQRAPRVSWQHKAA